MSFFSGRTRDHAWRYFDRHLAGIPLPQNAEDARNYLLEREENVELSTAGSYLTHIKAFGQYLGQRRWLDAARPDVISHIKTASGRQGRYQTATRKGLGRYTKYQRMVMLREFYKWLLDTDETPPQFRRMPFRKPTIEEQTRSRDDRLSMEEVKAMLVAAKDEMEQCALMLLLDSGFRAGELVALDIQDIRFDAKGAQLMHGRGARGLKTNRRRVPTRIKMATPYVKAWLGRHPFRGRRDWPLFISRSNRNHGSRLTTGALWSMVDRLSRRAQLRHVRPHMFRHTAASLRSADGWNEEMLRLHFGWSKGSEMPSLYSHIEADYDDFALRSAPSIPPGDPCVECGAIHLGACLDKTGERA